MTNLHITIAICVGLLFVFLAFFKFLDIRTAQTYKPSPEEVAEKLRRVLAGTMPWQEWDEFVCVPIRYDEELNYIHLRCAEMQTEAFTWRENEEDREKWIYNDTGLASVRDLLAALRKQIEEKHKKETTLYI